MFSLTEEQIAFIENDIKVRGITSPDLSIDLLDHICCLIENKLDEYRNFDTVYQETILLFGKNGLKEIQDETNRLLTFKHYYTMNKTMKISGYVSSLMILFGAFFKFNHWPGASPMMVLGVFFFTVLFLPLLFILKFKASAENNRSVVLSTIGFIAALAISAGVLFRIMHWPNARLLTITGCALLVLGYLPVYFLSIYKNTTNKINATATVILIIAGAGLFITESNTGLTRQVSDSFWRGVTENEQLLNFVKKENQLVYKMVETNSSSDSTSNSTVFKELRSSTTELIEYMENMKAFLISNTENISLEAAHKINIDELRTSGGGDITSEILFAATNSNYTAAKLKEKIENYKSIISKLDDSIDLNNLTTTNVVVYGESIPWEQSNFEKLPIPLIVFNLNRIELAVLATESAALHQLH
ncbi:MAG: hypothetical protein IPH89_13340 [Bacteroidetes bacterium]|nr:hypothetical protein [Bacteroidota bacterium]